MFEHLEYFDRNTITNAYFCNDPLEQGVVVEYVPDIELEKQGIYTIKPGQNGGIVIGVSLNEFINMDLYNYRLFPPYSCIDQLRQIGSKIDILQEGIIMIDLKKKRKINTLLFYNKKGRFTNKPQLNQKPIGIILDSDNDGWSKIKFRIWGI